MRTKTIKLYSFGELSLKARERAIETERGNLLRDWSGDKTIEDAKTMLAFAGFDIKDIHYSGFSSQGDGACFTGSWEASQVNPVAMKESAPLDAELHRIADELAKLVVVHPGVSFSVKQSGHYSHEYCTDFTFSFPDDAQDGTEDVEKVFITLARDAMRWIYRQLESDYEDSSTEAHAIESLNDSGNEYDEDGNLDT